jgi:hypothetical protein
MEETEETVSTLALAPSLRRSVLGLLTRAPAAEGWCRTRWSCATLALSLQARASLQVSPHPPDRGELAAARDAPVRG